MRKKNRGGGGEIGVVRVNKNEELKSFCENAKKIGRGGGGGRVGGGVRVNVNEEVKLL